MTHAERYENVVGTSWDAGTHYFKMSVDNTLTVVGEPDFSDTSQWLKAVEELERLQRGRNTVPDTPPASRTTRDECDDCGTGSKSGHDQFCTPGEHEVNGIRLPGIIQPRVLHWLKHEFTFRPDDILIVAYPKTGSTWLQALVHYILHVDTLRSQDASRLSDQPQIDVQWMATFLELQGNGPAEDESQDTRQTVRVFKTHLPVEFLKDTFKRGKPRILVIYRNPKDTLVSFYHFYRMFAFLGNFPGSWNDFFHLVSEERVVYGPVHEHMIGWKKELAPNSALYIRYEDLLTNIVQEIHQVAHYLGCPFADSDARSLANVTSFDNMKENPQLNMSSALGLNHDISPFMRKGESGDWKNYFTEKQNTSFEPCCQKLLSNGIHLNYG